MPDVNEALEARLKRVERYIKAGKTNAPDANSLDSSVIDKIDDLLGQAKDYREEIKAYKEQNAKLTAELAAAGANPATADDLKELTAYRALGKPEELRAAIEQGKAAQTDLATKSRKEQLTELAASLGWNADALLTIDNLSGGVIKIESETAKDAKGVETTRYFAVDGTTKTPYEEYIRSKHSALVTALEANPQARGRSGDDRRLPPQRASSGAPSTGAPSDDAVREDLDKRLSPSSML